MNPIWEVQIDLLEKFKQICEKYSIEYFAGAGTLLGAVRHKGFIPWDDDIDVFLKWPEFKRLMEVAPAECEYPYFFQSIYTDKECMPSACRLRRSDTTGFTRWELLNTTPAYNKGIFLDIIPVFNLPNSKLERKRNKKEVFYIWECITGHNYLYIKKVDDIHPWNKEKYIQEYQDYCKKHPGTTITDLKEKYLLACAAYGKGKEMGCTSVNPYCGYLDWETKWLEEFTDYPFENTTIKGPVMYDEILTKQFKDWRTPVKGASHHTYIVVDTQKPWTEFDMYEYLDKEFEKK